MKDPPVRNSVGGSSITLRPQALALLAALFIVLPLRSAAQPATAARKPTVLLVGSHYAYCGYDAALRLDKSSFALGKMHIDLDQQAFTWDDVRPYNVLVVTDLGRCNADMTVAK